MRNNMIHFNPLTDVPLIDKLKNRKSTHAPIRRRFIIDHFNNIKRFGTLRND